VHQIARLPRDILRLHIPPRGIIPIDINVAEGPFSQRQRWKIREEDFHFERLETSVDIIHPYPSYQTICALGDHGGFWDMDHL
jgi:hypothetical protein